MIGSGILVVDDSEANRDLLTRWLGGHGYGVRAVADGPAALAAVEETTFDLILLDIEMPVMSGLEVLAQIRRRHSPADLPVIMVSGRQDSESIVSALELGANDYITKPVDFAVGLARVNTQLARRRLEAARRSVDSLTGLANRAALLEWSEAQATVDRPAVALAINIDRFRTINNGLGRVYGDWLLVEASRRFKAALPAQSLLARVHADDFVALLHDADLDGATACAVRILEATRQPLELGGQRVAITASIGVADGSSGRVADELLDRADAALYRAKTLSGDRWESFATALQSRAAARLHLEMELRDAVARHEFTLRFEPFVDLRTGAVVGTEALVRWEHPARGELRPAEFIPVAEETRLILPMGKLVFRMACEALRDWREQALVGPDFRMSVNLSARQLDDPGLIEALRETMEETGVDPHALTLEITESVVVESSERTRVMFERARAMGMRVALDDFGTGYSSLSYLQSFSLDTLKIDRSFVQGLSRPEGGEIVRTLAHLADTLAMDVVAEGLEAGWQLGALRELGCTHGQGYVFGRPMLAPELLAAARNGYPVTEWMHAAKTAEQDR